MISNIHVIIENTTIQFKHFSDEQFELCFEWYYMVNIRIDIKWIDLKKIRITWVGHGDPLVFLVLEKKVLRMSLDMQTSPDYYLPIQIFDLIVLYLPNETPYDTFIFKFLHIFRG